MDKADPVSSTMIDEAVDRCRDIAAVRREYRRLTAEAKRRFGGSHTIAGASHVVRCLTDFLNGQDLHDDAMSVGNGLRDCRLRALFTAPMNDAADFVLKLAVLRLEMLENSAGHPDVFTDSLGAILDSFHEPPKGDELAPHMAPRGGYRARRRSFDDFIGGPARAKPNGGANDDRALT